MLKKASFCICLMILLLGIACDKKQQQDLPPSPSNVNNFKQLIKSFENPPPDYGTAPLWVWNDKVTKIKIERQLTEMKEQGILGVFVHPRPGLITPYLSDTWFELFDYTVKKGKELGMKVWIYDENSFPSGFGGGHVPAEMPESYNQGIALEMHKFKKLALDTSKTYPVVLKKQGNQFVDISANLTAQNKQKGEFYAFELKYPVQSKWFGGYSYVDLLIPGVTEKFIEVTMSGYEKTAAKEFGQAVPGVFTDEPNINPRFKKTIRYTPELFNIFKEKWGYDLKKHLPSLFEEVGDFKKIRHNYYETLLQLFIDRWSKPWFEYSEKKNLKWTGHYWEHGWPNPIHGGDNMAMYAWHQIPAIDMLFNTRSLRPDQFGNVRAVKEVISVANQMGRNRILSETYGGSGWDLKFEDIKRNGDWEYVLGVNFMNPHLTYMTISGTRKYDFPQSFSYHAPYWDYYHKLNHYFNRLSVALSSGQQINKTLVLEPTSTTWMYFSSISENTKMNKIGQGFEALVKQLAREQLEFDLGCENIIKDHGKAVNGEFIINQRTYNLLVIPPDFENFNSPTVSVLKNYLNQGGKVISFSDIPTLVDGVKSDEIVQAVKKNEQNWIRVKNITDSKVQELLKSNSFKVEFPVGNKAELYHQRRTLNDGQLLFFANYDTAHIAHAKIHISAKTLIELDPFTGKYYKYPFNEEKNKMNFTFQIPPAGSKLFFASNKPINAPETPKTHTPGKELNTKGIEKIVRNNPNILYIDYCDLKLGDSRFKSIHHFDATDTVFRYHGFKEGNPWSTGVQYKSKVIDRDTFPKGTGYEADFYFNISPEVTTKNMKLVVEQPAIWKISLNGQIIKPEPGKWWLDRNFGVYNIEGIAHPGKNKITIVCDPMSVIAEIEPVYIIGDFDLKAKSQSWQIIPETEIDLKPWNKQGLPFYPSSISYIKNINIDNTNTNYLVKLNKWNGTTAVIYVNNQQAGILVHQPWQVEISKFLKKGENKIEIKVIGSLHNLLGPHHGKLRPGLVTPWSWRFAPDYPAGDKYQTIEYGLFEDFSVIKCQ